MGKLLTFCATQTWIEDVRIIAHSSEDVEFSFSLYVSSAKYSKMDVLVKKILLLYDERFSSPTSLYKIWLCFLILEQVLISNSDASFFNIQKWYEHQTSPQLDVQRKDWNFLKLKLN